MKKKCSRADKWPCVNFFNTVSCEVEIIIGNVFGILLGFFGLLPSICAECWLAGKTRNTKEVCYGKCSPLTPSLARAANLPEGTLVCLYHRRSIEREDDRCSSPFKERHSKKLTVIPVRLYGLLDRKGKEKTNYHPGSKWCYSSKSVFYKNAEGDCDMAVTKRRKVNIIIPLPKRS